DDAVIAEESEKGFSCTAVLSNCENLVPTAFSYGARLGDQRRNFLTIEPSFGNGEEAGILSDLLESDGEMVQVAFVSETCVLQELRLIFVRLRLRRPREKLRNKRSAAQFGDIQEETRVRIGRHHLKKIAARGGTAAAISLVG